MDIKRKRRFTRRFKLFPLWIAILYLSRPERVRHQHGDGHGTHAAWNRGDKSRHFLRFAETNIAHQPLTTLLSRIRDSIDAHINDRCTGFDPIAAHHLRFANGSDENIRLSYNTRKILCA